MPRVYVEKIVTMLRASGLSPLAFEVVPKAIARAVLPKSLEESVMVVHIMNKKTGIYIVCGGVVCFTSTVSWGSQSDINTKIDSLLSELVKVNEYWISHHPDNSKLSQAILVGNDCGKFESNISGALAEAGLPVSIGNVWTNAFNLDNYIPPIMKDESLKYAVSAGLAMEL